MASDVTIYLQAVHQPAVDGIDKVTKATDRMTTAVKKSTLGINLNGAAVSANTRGMSKWAKSGVQQAGYQIGDLAVQLDGGTSFLRAFGQQGSQHLGIFGPLGAVLGTGVAIVAAFGNAFFVNKDPVKSFSDEVGDLTTAVNKYIKVAPTGVKETRELGLAYHKASEGARMLFDAEKTLEQLALQDQINQIKTALRGESRELVGLVYAQRLYNRTADKQAKLGPARISAQEHYERAVQKVASSMKVGSEAAEKLGSIMEELDRTDPFEDAARTANLLQSFYDALTKSGAKLTEGQKELLTPIVDSITAFRTLAGLDLVDTTESVKLLKDEVKEVAMVTSGMGAMFNLALSDAENLAAGMAGSIGGSFKSIILGTSSVKDAFKNMALAIIDQLLQVLVIQQIVGAIAGTVGSVSAGGVATKGTGLSGVFSGTNNLAYGPHRPRAIGGSVQSGSTYLVGERGPELFMANSSGSIVPNNKMGGGAGVVVNQTINVSTGVAQTVRTEIMSMMPQISEAAKGAVADANQRGGSYSRAI